MDKVIMLGTGNGGTMNLYNTCFLMNHNNQNFLVDTGGSIEIVKRLKEKSIDIKDIHHIFISHQHTDHLLGLIWMFKKLGRAGINGELKERLNIYCNREVYDAIYGVGNYLLPKKLMTGICDFTNFIILEDNDKHIINDIEYTFFDVHAKKERQFGFSCTINNSKIVFLGDETMDECLKEKVKNADYVMHEAFCLDSEESIFGAYEKKHSTVKHACELMNRLSVKNLILFHTEDSHGKERKALYESEGNKYFDGKVIVPDDMEEINI